MFIEYIILGATAGEKCDLNMTFLLFLSCQNNRLIYSIPLKFSTLSIINMATSVGWHIGTFCQPEKCQLLSCRYTKHAVFSLHYCACIHNPQGAAKWTTFPAAFMHGSMWLEEISKLSQYLSSKISWCF